MEKIGKALERRGASFVWAGRGHTSKGETPVQVERFRELVPRCQAGGKLSTGTDRSRNFPNSFIGFSRGKQHGLQTPHKQPAISG